ncbi:MAG: DUF488 domain-containing protein [Planctomycetaceae bacterium]|nr:DUF488 domain-containing protein [Planctomycetaceae bacterium]
MTKHRAIRLKRVYEEASPDDGFRILVERLWPRGIKKEKARIDLWMKEIAPSTELRQWFQHDVEKWDEFCKRYREELKENGDAAEQLKTRLKDGPVTFVFASKDEEHNSAVVLKAFLEEWKPSRSQGT